jgi:Fic family protein/DNA-binding XRE family transcriptional regulator
MWHMRDLIRNARISKGLKTRELAQILGVDQALISKFENGSRLPTKKQVVLLATNLDLSVDDLMVNWIKQRVIAEYGQEEQAVEAIRMVQEELAQYSIKRKSVFSSGLNELLIDIDRLRSQLENLREFDSYRIAQALELEYTYESNRIEGNTLTLRETDLVINEGLTISGKSMKEHLEVLNHNEAIEYIKDLVQRKVPIRERELLQIHNLVLRGIMPENAGKYRSVQVMIKGSAHTPPQPFLVQKQMEEYFIWYAENQNRLHPVILAAEMHERLVTIHPFIDGNGRTSRLIMNLILLRNGYVIANIKGDSQSRIRYYEALEQVQVGGNKEAFITLVAEVERDCLQRHLTILGA